MAVPYRWTIRGVDVRLVRRLRVLALLRGVTVPILLNQALAEFLDREERREDTSPQSPQVSQATTGGRLRPAAGIAD
jgi:hypothetical protein